MNIEDFIAEVHNASRKFFFIRRIELVDATNNTAKLRLEVGGDCFIQIYANLERTLINFVVVFNRRRIYGRDCNGGIWHRHSYEAPDEHDFSPEGRKKVSIEEFLRETQESLERSELL